MPASVCPRCYAPMNSGVSKCTRCGFDRRVSSAGQAPASAPRGSSLLVGLAFLAIAALVAGSVVVYAAAQSGGNPAHRPTASPSASVAATPGYLVEPTGIPIADRTTVRWFVGLGSGTLMSQIEAQKAFVANYNASNKDGIAIQLEVVENSTAYEVLKTEMAAGNSPDIIGPVGVKGRNGFEGQFMDLTSEIQKNKVDLSAYDPALVTYLQEGGAQIGLPYDIFPGYVWYNKDLFKAAGLPDLPTLTGEQYRGQDWTWDALAKVAAQLTVDKNGFKASDAAFDSHGIVQYGLDFQWAEARRIASCFGGGSFVGSNGTSAQIPAPWADGLSWYYSGIWNGHFIPDGAAEASPLLGNGYPMTSGRLAMNVGWAWSLTSIASSASTARVKNWDIAVMPSWKGTTTSPLDADTFTISKASKNPDAAFKAMEAVMADPSLMKSYGGEPARKADQAAYFTSFDATLAPIFPGNRVTWSVLDEMAKVPAFPSHEADMPNSTAANADIDKFLSRLKNVGGMNVQVELANLQQTLQKDFDSSAP
jgi:multiple sugar transport system substrate-binding protein